eukprot:tig00021518_g22023.t1
MQPAASSAAPFSIRDRQTAALRRMLLLNQSGPDAAAAAAKLGEPSVASSSWQTEVWKVLVYDKFCRDIISPLLKVGDLRKLGITLHMLLHTERQQVPDVPAVYFVQPTEENIQRIASDLRERLYDSSYLNFASSIPRPLLEKLADATLQSESVSLVSKVFDQHLNFVSLEPQLFSLHMPGSYAALRDPAATDAAMKKYADQIVSSLFSVCVTLGCVPIIRASRGNAAEMIAQQLEGRLREHLQHAGRNNLFASSSASSAAFQRPVLVLLDRDMDVPVILHHTWTYQALVHDALASHLNRVTVQVADSKDADGTEKMSAKTYDLDPADSFWAANAGSPFPKVAEEVEAALQQYKADVEALNRKTGAQAAPAPAAEGAPAPKDDSLSTAGLASAIESLPELTERKRLIDQHTNIATALLGAIKSRELDNYFALEESLLNRGLVDRQQLLAQLASSGKGTPSDKVRLLAMYYLLTENLSATDMEPLESMLAQQGADISPLAYLKKEKAMKATFDRAAFGPAGGAGAAAQGGIMDLASGAFSKVQGYGIGLLSGVRNVLVTEKMLRATRVVDAVMEMKPEADALSYHDPRVARSTEAPRTRTPFRDAVVFVVGGGNYVEYQNIVDYCKKQAAAQAPKRVVYGSTELVTAEQFLAQLGQLHRGPAASSPAAAAALR